MPEKRRVLTLTVAFCAAFVALLSSVFIISHADHDCGGDNCLMCKAICVCEKNLNVMALTLTAGAVTPMPFPPLRANVFQTVQAFSSVTLVSLKVKLSN